MRPEDIGAPCGGEMELIGGDAVPPDLVVDALEADAEGCCGALLVAVEAAIFPRMRGVSFLRARSMDCSYPGPCRETTAKHLPLSMRRIRFRVEDLHGGDAW